MTPEEIQSRLLYRDALMLIIDKPAGLPVHAGPKGGPNLEENFVHLQFGLPRPPALAHRLDRDTSGCLVLGRHRKALAKLGRLFQQGNIDKTYWAIVHGMPAEASGIINLPLKKLNEKWGWKMIAAQDGQTAVTEYRVLGSVNGFSWMEFRPKTGRTHQIRVHAASLGCPILGEHVYAEAATERLHLHARAVAVPLYANKPAVMAEAQPPSHMQAALQACGYIFSEGASSHS